jgi:prohibitin 1
MYDVRGGTRAVIFDRLSGVKKDVVEEGTHFLIPWLQRAVIYDVRTKPRNISTTTGSKDLQMVSLTLRVLHRPNVQELPRIYQVISHSHIRGPTHRHLDWIMMREYYHLLETKS